MLTLSKKLAAGIAATTAVAAVALAAPQAQAASTNAEDFFGTPSTLTDIGWTADGVDSDPTPLFGPLDMWTADLFAAGPKSAIFSVSRAGMPPVVAPPDSTAVTRYSITGNDGPHLRGGIKTVGFAVDYAPLTIGSGGTAQKLLYADAGFTQLVGTLTIPLNVADNALLILDKAYDTLWVADSFTLTNGVLSSYTNTYTAVPEPMTMLGASAAVAFGTAFKRRQAKKG